MDEFSSIEYGVSSFGGNGVIDSAPIEGNSMEMGSDRDSFESVDYSSYFEDIVDDFEFLIGLYDDDVNLSDIHKDLTITNFLIIFFIVLFVGNKLVNRIRSI